MKRLTLDNTLYSALKGDFSADEWVNSIYRYVSPDKFDHLSANILLISGIESGEILLTD